MRGTTDPQTTMPSTLTPESMIPPDHPIRRIKKVVEAVLADLDPEFDAMSRRPAGRVCSRSNCSRRAC